MNIAIRAGSVPKYIAGNLRSRPNLYRQYQSAASSPSQVQTSSQSEILTAALRLVPDHGFSIHALRLGAQDAGYPAVSASHFSDGPFALVNHHLITQRLALSSRFQRPEIPIERYETPRDILERVQTIAWSRLQANKPLIAQYQGALALMSTPSNLTKGLKELARLADEILYLAGATAVTTAWYTDRAGLASIYASTELYMTQDQSPGFGGTQEFLARRLDEASQIRSSGQMVSQWLGMQIGGLVNGIRSKGIRI